MLNEIFQATFGESDSSQCVCVCLVSGLKRLKRQLAARTN